MAKVLFLSGGVLWETETNPYEGYEYLVRHPLCALEGCRGKLTVSTDQNSALCELCEKSYHFKGGLEKTHELATKRWYASHLLDHEVRSLDLPPTKVVTEDSDDSYWVKAKIVERGGKRMAVIYVGEVVGPGQKKEDYAQLFVDLDDEQLRFDKTNRNPLRILAKLTAEFPGSRTVLEGKARKA